MEEKKIHRIVCGPLGVNTFVVPVGDGKAFVVDPAGCKMDTVDELVVNKFLRENGLDPVLIVLTHGHFDHIFAVPALSAEFPGAKLAIHKNDAMMIGEAGSEYQANHLARFGYGSLKYLPLVSNIREPDVLLAEGMTLAECVPEMGGEASENLAKWRVMHTPGHTPGGICLYNESDDMIITGDTIFFRAVGRTDMPGGDERLLECSIGRILTDIKDSTLIYPGHDRIAFTKKD